MKRILLFIFIVCPFFVAAQSTNDSYLWPIKDAAVGTGVAYAPQSYIDNELNFGNLFITAPEGSVVVSPVDGVIQRVALRYIYSLTKSSSFEIDDSFNSAREKNQKGEHSGHSSKSLDLKFLVGQLVISDSKGSTIFIEGLLGDEIFKTGQIIKKGTPIGHVGHSYYKIKEPSISVSISFNGKIADPMSPFGIKSTFVQPGIVKPVETLTKAQVKEDFLTCIDAVKESFPGLYNVLSKEELALYVDQTIARIEAGKEVLNYTEYEKIISNVSCKIHDSHIYIHYPERVEAKNKPSYKPSIHFGWINDTLICTNAIKDYEHLIGRQIIAINGMDADSMKAIVISKTGTYDAKVQQYVDYVLATTGFLTLLDELFGNGKFEMNVEFAGGQKINIESNTKNSSYVSGRFDFWRINHHENNYELKTLSDSVAYIGLSTFDINQTQLAEIENYIRSISDKRHLIIDVRNNPGGDVKLLSKIYSYIAGKPMNLDGYSRVSKKGGFECFKYSLNYNGVSGDIFPEYAEEKGKEGYYLRSEADNAYYPDSTTNYKGNVYVLTNEWSASASACLAALVVRNHRGVIVGRETLSAYHFMNALKSAQIRLPNSGIVVIIPLVEVCFDTVVNERVPIGRGVLPDYFVPITLDELSYRNGDAILNYALQLIVNGEYLKGDNPFEKKVCDDEDAPVFFSGSNIIIIGLGILIIVMICIVMRYQTIRRRNEIT